LAFKYFCEIFANVPSVRRSSSALLSSGSSPLFLRAAKPCSLFRRSAHGLVVGVGEVGVHRDAVVDHHIHPALVEQRDGLGEALHRFHPGAGVAGDLRPVAGNGLAGDLALDVGQRLDGVVVGPRDDDALADRVRFGQVVLRPAGRQHNGRDQEHGEQRSS
jgi:hypothetical protein